MVGTTSAEIDIQVMGAPLNPMVRNLLVAAEVDSSMFVPSQFRLVFRGTTRDVLLAGGLQLAVMVTIQITGDAAPTPLINGEITAVEADFGPDGAMTIVRGLDRSHRLMRGTKTMAYPMLTASAVVTTLIGQAAIPPGVIVPTTNMYTWLSQANVSSWTFIQQLAALENCVAYVNAMGLFCFGPMPMPAMGLPPVLAAEQPPMGTQLVMGRNLIRLRAVVNAGEQVPLVTVMGWDDQMGLPVIGPSPTLPSTAMSIDPSTLPAVVAAEFGALPFFDTSRPFDSEGAATTRAEAIAADIAGAMAELEGQCIGNPAIVAGESVSLGLAGPPFDGQYIVTSARHVFEPSHGGYTTWFTVGGRQDRGLLSLASGGSPVDANRPSISGLVTGTVVDNMDEEGMGRVKVMFPWLSPAYVSAWAPTMQIGAGKVGGYGFLFVPEVGDQVLIGFDRGDIDHPYVIGNLYGGLSSPMPAPSIDGVVASRRIMSRMRHMIQFDDGPEAMGITIQTGTQTCSIKIDAIENSIAITSVGKVTIETAAGMSVKTGGDFEVQAAGNVSLQGAAGVKVQSAGQLSMAGAAGATLEGSTVSISSPAISLGA